MKKGAGTCYLYSTEGPLKPKLIYKHKRPTPVTRGITNKDYTPRAGLWADNSWSILVLCLNF